MTCFNTVGMVFLATFLPYLNSSLLKDCVTLLQASRKNAPPEGLQLEVQATCCCSALLPAWCSEQATLVKPRSALCGAVCWGKRTGEVLLLNVAGPEKNKV